jgi:translocation and assembly module TamA
VVEKLRIEGAHQLSPSTIKAGIATEATGWWWPFAAKKYFDPLTWQSDLRRIERIYEARGYYQANVLSDQVKSVKGGVELTATVNEGAPTRIASFEVDGLDTLTEKERTSVLHRIGLSVGDIFLEEHWQSAKSTIVDRVRNLGFFTVEASGRALVDTAHRQARLLIRVDPGPRYRFGAIEVQTGSPSRVAPAWIWDVVRLAIPEGKPYSDAALTEAERRVFAMGVFVVVKVTAGTPNPAAGRVPIRVETREAPPRTLRAGVGARVDQIRNEARAIAQWDHLDFLGGMRKLSLRGEAGWAFIPNVYAVARNDLVSGPRNGPIARLSSSFQQPRLFARPNFVQRSSLDVERTLEQAYDSLGARLSAGIAWLPHSKLSIVTSYNLQGYYLNGPAIASVSAAPLTLGCTGQVSNCFILLSYIEEIITWDDRDSPLEARDGFYASLALQQGGGPLGGDFGYIRVLPDVRGYLSFGEHKRVTLATRLRAGELFSFGEQSAVVTRFFSGGGVSMRGFSDRRLSPLLLAPAPATSLSPAITLTLPIGGNGLVEGSFESRYQLTSNLVIALFLDFGQVTQGLFRPNDLSTVLWAWGIGLRYLTVIGPIRIDLARRLQVGRPPALYAIDSATGAVTAVPYAVNDSCFGIGGSGRSTPVADSLCSFSIAIGEAF